MRARLLDVERGMEGLDRRLKGREGQAGQEAKKQRAATALSVEEELRLKAAVEQRVQRRPRIVPDPDGLVQLTPEQLNEARAKADAEAKAQGL